MNNLVQDNIKFLILLENKAKKYQLNPKYNWIIQDIFENIVLGLVLIIQILKINHMEFLYFRYLKKNLEIKC